MSEGFIPASELFDRLRALEDLVADKPSESADGRLSVPGMSAAFEPRRATRVAIVGDSISGGAWVENGGSPYYSAGSFWTQANIRLRQRFTLVESNFAASGAPTFTLVDGGTVADAAASDADIVVVLAGTNDSTGSTGAEIADRLLAIWRTLTQAGKLVVAGTITPRAFGDSSSDVVRAANHLIRANARVEPGVVLCDWYATIVDPSTGEADSDFLAGDNVHPNATGHSRMGKVLADTLAGISPGGDGGWLPMTYGDADGMMPNPFMLGDTSGAANSTSFYDLGSGTSVKSKVARTDGVPGEWQQLVITAPTPNADGAQIQQQNTNVGVDWNVGDTVYGVMEFETDASGWNGYHIQLAVYFFTAGNAVDSNRLGSSDRLALTVAPLRIESGVLRTPAIAVPATTTRLQLNGYFYGPGTVRVSRFDIIRTATA